jgi:hypothetical protein
MAPPRPTPAFESFALSYGRRRIAACPLILDEDGIAKRPAKETYPSFKPEDNLEHDWSCASGLGIVLGRPSGNLAVVDADDQGLSDFLLRLLGDWPNPPLMVRTARGRLHIYCIETAPSVPVDLEVWYSGRRCLVQLLAAGCQVAAPPTPGYRWINAQAQPLYGDVGEVWRSIALEHRLPYREARPWSFLRRERSRGPTTAQVREAML